MGEEQLGVGLGGKDQESSFIHIESKMPSRHPSGVSEQVVGYTILELRGKAQGQRSD